MQSRLGLVLGGAGSASLILVGLFGAVGGVGVYTFIYADGGSYLSNDPAACVNCHVMREQYDGWHHGSHKAVATCNDCHTPHDFAGKWVTKAINGFNHSLAFTVGGFHEPIQITPRNAAVTEGACRHCHQEVVQMIDAHAAGATGRSGEAISCIRCHRDVGHSH